MIDRAFNVHLVELACAPDAYQGVGTLLDGELVQTLDGAYKFLIFDCVALAGRSLVEMPLYHDRLDAARHFCQEYLQPRGGDAFALEHKRFFALRNLDRLWESLPQLDHAVDGLVFTPLHERIRTGRQFSLLKWKWATEHTIDARVACDGAAYCLQLADGRHWLDWLVLAAGSAGAAQCAALGLGAHNSGAAIVECRWLPQTGEWAVERWRHDKAVPNTRLTAELTLQNIEENITIEELYAVAAECMAKYNDKTKAQGRAQDKRPRDRSPKRSASPPYSAPSPRRSASPPLYHPSPPRRSPSPDYSPASPPRTTSPDLAPDAYAPAAPAAPAPANPMQFVHPDRIKRMAPAPDAPAQAAPAPTSSLLGMLNSLMTSGVLEKFKDTQ
jgi:hypothetical protein